MAPCRGRRGRAWHRGPMRRPRLATVLGIGIPVLVVMVLLAAWAFDTSAAADGTLPQRGPGRLRRGRPDQGGGHRRGGPTSARVRRHRRRRSATAGTTIESTASDLGLAVDQPATVRGRPGGGSGGHGRPAAAGLDAVLRVALRGRPPLHAAARPAGRDPGPARGRRGPPAGGADADRLTRGRPRPGRHRGPGPPCRGGRRQAPLRGTRRRGPHHHRRGARGPRARGDRRGGQRPRRAGRRPHRRALRGQGGRQARRLRRARAPHLDRVPGGRRQDRAGARRGGHRCLPPRADRLGRPVRAQGREHHPGRRWWGADHPLGQRHDVLRAGRRGPDRPGHRGRPDRPRGPARRGGAGADHRQGRGPRDQGAGRHHHRVERPGAGQVVHDLPPLLRSAGHQHPPHGRHRARGDRAARARPSR